MLALRTHVRNADWHDDLSLWKSAVAAAPDSFKAHKGYSNALWDAGCDEPAIDAAIARIELGLAVLDQKPLPPERRDNTLFHDLGMYYRIKGDFLSQRDQQAEARRFSRNPSTSSCGRGRLTAGSTKLRARPPWVAAAPRQSWSMSATTMSTGSLG